MIVGVLVAVFGIGIGVGIALDHEATSADPSAAQIVERQRVLAQRAARVEEQQHARAEAQNARAEAQQTRALQQLAWVQECTTLYTVPPDRNDPTWVHQSALRASCVAAARSGVSPAAFRRERRP